MRKKQQAALPILEEQVLLEEYQRLSNDCKNLNDDIDAVQMQINDCSIDQKLWKQANKVYQQTNHESQIAHYFAQKDLAPTIEKLQNEQKELEEQLKKVTRFYSTQRIMQFRAEADFYYQFLLSIGNSFQNNETKSKNPKDEMFPPLKAELSTPKGAIDILEKQIQQEIEKHKVLETDLQHEIDKKPQKTLCEEPAILALQEELTKEQQKLEKVKKNFARLVSKQKAEISEHRLKLEAAKRTRLQQYLDEKAKSEKKSTKPKIFFPAQAQAPISSNPLSSNSHTTNTLNVVSTVPNNSCGPPKITDENNDATFNHDSKIQTKPKAARIPSRLASLVPSTPPASLKTAAPSLAPEKKQIKKPTKVPKKSSKKNIQTESLVETTRLLTLVNSKLNQLFNDDSDFEDFC